MRGHAVAQAQLVWMFAQEVDTAAVQRFAETGSFAMEPEKSPEDKSLAALTDVILADIKANGGKLIVDEVKFRRMSQELEEKSSGK